MLGGQTPCVTCIQFEVNEMSQQVELVAPASTPSQPGHCPPGHLALFVGGLNESKVL